MARRHAAVTITSTLLLASSPAWGQASEVHKEVAREWSTPSHFDPIALATFQDEPAPPSPPPTSPFRSSTLITLRPQYWMPSLEGSMSLDNSLGFSTSLDFADDLNVNDVDGQFAWEVGIELGPAFFRVSGYSFSSSALDTANQTITFGDVTIPVGDLFDADLDLTNVKLQAGWSLFNLKDHGFILALTAGLDLFHVDASIEDPTTLLSDSIDENLPLPIVGAHLEVPIDRFLIAADVSGLGLEVQDVNFGYLDVSASLTWMPIDHLGIFAGYRYIHFDLDASDFTLDATLSGPFFGIEVRF